MDSNTEDFIVTWMFLFIITITLTILKLTDVIVWSWWWVTFPLWTVPVVALGCLLVLGVLTSLEYFVQWLDNKKKQFFR